ncbi:prolyl oligopeptidase family serine peptidase [Bradyrhizobium sp. 160]|uniref:prolyl oligopeptidase family serine peptidase n=1 Tax=Bradyrhizobium sp. 160 TaxID=2782634 RepID=UPI00320B042D
MARAVGPSGNEAADMGSFHRLCGGPNPPEVTSPRRLGVVGASQEGLLVGTAITQRRDLFNAAIVQVALFDMLRFTKSGWRSRHREQRGWIEAYSPYQKLVPGKTCPVPFILTSTKDSGVNPPTAVKRERAA